MLDWLTERRDKHELREQRLETVEWAILGWVFIGVVADIVLVMRDKHAYCKVVSGKRKACFFDEVPSRQTQNFNVVGSLGG